MATAERVSPHPASGLFPLMDGVELAALVDDIREHGLLDPIVLHEGLVLDGRNRLRACELAGVEPRFVEWQQPDGMSATEWVVSVNLHRRHLTTAQRAALALDLLPRLEEEARERQREAGGAQPGPLRPETDEAKGRADEKAAALVGVGRSTVAAAKAIQQRDETGEIVNQMRAGQLNVAQAARDVGFTGLAQGGGDVLTSSKRTAHGRENPTHYGKGDKWKEATLPLMRYLRAWKRRDYEFKHVNWKEAQRRLRVLDELLRELEAARADIASRSQKAKLTV